jgi:hypothetical protein
MGAYGTASVACDYENDGHLYFYFNSVSYDISIPSTSLFYDKWAHWAITRSSGSVKLFLGGTQTGTTQAIGDNHTDSTNKLYIGNEDVTLSGTPFQSQYSGKITNFHWVKGTSLYNSNFTPPTTTISPVANSKLLILANDSLPLVDSSGQSKTVNNTLVTWSSSTPF